MIALCDPLVRNFYGVGKSDKLAELISCNATINIQTVAATAATLNAARRRHRTLSSF